MQKGNHLFRLAGAVGAMLLLGGSLAPWSLAVAQTMPVQTGGPGLTSAPDLGFAVAQTSFLTYQQQHGGVRTLGLPLSRDFQLLGRRVQIFERQVLQQQADGSVRALDLLGDALPLVHADGATFPTDDPDMLDANPPLDARGYQDLALAAIDSGRLDATAPDNWNDLPVRFRAKFRATVTCAELASYPCDERKLLRAALDVWGLPSSVPTFDPGNPDLVYLRFQRGIMQFSQSTGQTQAVPLGAWFKRVLIGTDVPDDLQSDVLGSRFYGQFAPELPLGVARPAELPATSLSAAFSPSTTATTTITVAAVGSPGAADGSATPVFAQGMPTFGAVATSGTPTITPVALFAATGVTPTPITTLTSIDPSATSAVAPPFAAGVATPSAPQGPDPCAGDEQILFAPKKPYVATDVLIAVTSGRHHDVRSVRLTGPVKTGTVNERPGLNGWVWEWTISPTIEGWHEFTFFSDGARACATSGFNALPSFGAPAVASPSPTLAPFSTPVPVLTATPSPTATPVPAPSLAGTSPAEPASGACSGRLLRLNGSNFGASQSALSGNVLFSGPTGATVATIFSWTNSTILLSVPTGQPAGSAQIVVTTTSGASSPLTYQLGVC